MAAADGARRDVECYAITEEHAGSDVADLAATARRDGDDYVLDGEKWHVTSYNEATYAFFQARLVGRRARGRARDVLRRPAHARRPRGPHAGVHPHHRRTTTRSWRSRTSACRPRHLVGGEGDGMTFAHEWFRFERLMVAARCLGAAERLVEEATAFAQRAHRRRRAAGRVPARAGHARRQPHRAVRRPDDGLRRRPAPIDDGVDRKVAHAQCSMAKLYASEMAGRVADRAVQIFGGRGYMRENVAERFYRELRVERIWEGASEVQRVIIAGQLAKRGLRALV